MNIVSCDISDAVEYTQFHGDTPVMEIPRKTMAINNICDIITDEKGEHLYMVSRGRNQFLEKRELSFGCKHTQEECLEIESTSLIFTSPDVTFDCHMM